MFTNIAKFFIENGKLTLVLVVSTLLLWISSYIILPKQYNPEITMPAFEIRVSTPSLSSDETNRYVVSELENKLMEIEEIDEVFWISWEEFAYIMAKFDVWVDKEKAKIRINQKLNENLDLKPIWVSDPVVKSIDPDLLPQITFSISMSENSDNDENDYIYLKQIASQIKNEVKQLKNITTIDIVWWYSKDIIIDLDTKILKDRNISLSMLYQKLKNSNLNFSLWNIKSNNSENTKISLDWKFNELENVKKLKIQDDILLEDLWNIRYWINKLNKLSLYNWNSAVFLWFGKQVGSNWIFVTSDIKEKIEEIKKTLPKNIEINVIQDEWETAKNATNMLLTNLFQSIIIVVIILSLSLGFKNALNTAISIPLTLFSVFTISLIIWENINRITLFALILVLWMLVDDSTVVVENISRHLKNISKTWKKKLDAILDAIKEVELWVVLSTVTRLFAFSAMFFVSWMMWEYMWPIPKFALMASVISTMVALTVNPWISFYLQKWDKAKEKEKKKKFSIRKYYLWILEIFLWDSEKKQKRRKIFKISFWVALFLVIILPIYGGVFKARMLPKSNQDQIYVWIDAPRWWSTEKMWFVENDLNIFLQNYKINIDKEIIKSVSSTIWQAFTDDFANLFRWWSTRTWENQISSRINLYSSEQYKDLYNEKRITSEWFTILLRDELREKLLSKYPDLQIRILEDPPGPPVRSTFMAKIKSSWEEIATLEFARKVESKIREIAPKQELVDIYNSLSTSYRKLNMQIDYYALEKSWLDIETIKNELSIILSWVPINIYKNSDSLNPTNIILKIKDDEINTTSIINEITIKNSFWIDIPLSSIVKTNYEFVESDIQTDKREKTISIYWELANNSLVYPQIKIIKTLLSDDFTQDIYKLKSWSPYEIVYTWLKDWREYKIEWWWEWELTLDTFRDLWIAMMIALVLIYLLLVGQFKNFRVAWIIMIAFLLWFFWVFPWFSFLYLVSWEYFSATSMIWIIALAWIVVWNSIILIEYINIMKENGLTIKDALLKAWYTRFKPIILTSLTTMLWAATIIWDPVRSWLARSIIWWLMLSAILTLIVIPIFYYDSQKKNWQ